MNIAEKNLMRESQVFKEIMKSAVNLDKMFDFNYIQSDEEINAIR